MRTVIQVSGIRKTYGATVPLDRKMAPDATPVRVMLDLDYPRLWSLYKRLLTAK